MLKKYMQKVLYNLPIKPFMKDCILLDSKPAMSDNAYFVYRELLKKGYNKKYKLIWVVNKSSEIKEVNEENVFFISREDKLKFTYYNFFAKYIIDCNPYIKKRNKNQFRILLTHGCPTKLIDGFVMSCGKADYLITAGKPFSDIKHECYDGKDLIDNIIETGFPRNDTFFNKEDQLVIFPEIDRKKTIMWLPTYRNRTDAKEKWDDMKDIDFPLGIPCIDNVEQLQELNAALKEWGVLLLLKPHPVQDLSKIKEVDLSNLKIIYDKDFKEGTTLYNYLPLMDGLITDYSSVYWDFLIANKPVGLAIPDKEIYLNLVKMPYDYDEAFIGEQIKTFDELKSYIRNVATDNDVTKEKREKSLNKYHKYNDGNSSKRVVALLEDRINNKEE